MVFKKFGLKKFGLWLAIATLSCLSVFWSALPGVAQLPKTEQILRTASYGWKPFIYEEVSGGTRSITGLDVHLASLAFSRIGYEVVYEGEQSWGDLLKDLKTGKKDIVISALKRPEREKFAYYSDVFRSSVNVLYLPRNTGKTYSMKNTREMLKVFDKSAFRLGVVNGYSYGEKAIDDYINAPENSSRIVKVENDEALFNSLAKGQLDGFLIDQIVGADIAYRRGLQSAVEEYPLRISELSYYVIFSKKTVSQSLVREFNDSVNALRKSGEYNQQVQQYLFPVLLEFTTGQQWYFIVELVGVVSFAISGLILASREKYDIFGAFVLATLPGVGGGVIRDIFARRATLGLMRAPIYLIAVIVTVLVGYFVIHIFGRLQQILQKRRAVLQIASDIDLINPSIQSGSVTAPMDAAAEQFSSGSRSNPTCKPGLFFWLGKILSHRLTFTTIIELLDALGLSTLSIIGVIVALETKSTPLWLWGPIFAAITSAGGGILRDMVRADPNNSSLKGSFYPLIAVIWGLIFSMFIIWYSNRLNYYPDEIFLAVMCVIAGSFLTRIVAILLRIKTPSYFYAKADEAIEN